MSMIAVRTPAGSDAVIGKVYAADREDVYRAMEEIRGAGFGPADAFAIPEPLAWVPELRLLLQERVSGPRAKQIFLAADEAARAQAAVRAARWLARFQARAPRSGPTTEPARQLEAVDRWSHTVARLGEPVASQAGRLARRLNAEAAAAGGRDLCAGHGSYHCHQIILTGDRTVTFDWDTHDVADPARDVARFIVALQRLAIKYLGSLQALDAAAGAFLETYLALSPFAVTASLPWHRALTCLRLAKYEANRPAGAFPGGIEGLLGEGLHALDQARAVSS